MSGSDSDDYESLKIDFDNDVPLLLHVNTTYGTEKTHSSTPCSLTRRGGIKTK